MEFVQSPAALPNRLLRHDVIAQILATKISYFSKIPDVRYCACLLGFVFVLATDYSPRSEARAAQAFEPSSSISFVQVPAGSFLMGCSPDDLTYLPTCPDDEVPQHRVQMSRSFELGRFEVTQAQWQSVMGANPSYFKGADRPVEQVAWNDAQGFLTRMNERGDGYVYRLPTEAEWEYAARAAASGAAADSSLEAVGWFDVRSPTATPLLESTGQTHAVGLKQPNAWALYDMRGNVMEWVQDWYAPDYYKESAHTNPSGPSSPPYQVLGPYHIARGGCYHTGASYLRASDRYRTVAGLRRRDIGFRVARERIPIR